MGTPPPKPEDDYWWTAPPAGSCAEDQKCSIYLKYEAEGAEDPVFAAGIWNEGEAAEALRADAELLQSFVEAGCRFWDDGAGRQALVDISIAMPMGDIAAKPELEDQHRDLATFYERVLRTLTAGPSQ